MALIVGGTTVTGTQTLDATKLTGNLPALNGAALTALNGTQVTSGTVADARIPAFAASKITSGAFADARIPSLAASKITSGSFADARIPALAASKITSGTMSGARISGGTFGAVSAANLTSLPVSSAIPVVALASVGSYAMLNDTQTANPNGTLNPGNYGNNNDNYRGHYAEGSGTLSSSYPAGTWRIHGYISGGGSSTWQRIS
tara:strand:+ start:313 stop:924 length:612 start_codon:yes stop_codon:yes gene_type:complete